MRKTGFITKALGLCTAGVVFAMLAATPSAAQQHGTAQQPHHPQGQAGAQATPTPAPGPSTQWKPDPRQPPPGPS